MKKRKLKQYNLFRGMFGGQYDAKKNARLLKKSRAYRIKNF